MSTITIGTAPDSWGVWFPSDPEQLPAELLRRAGIGLVSELEQPIAEVRHGDDGVHVPVKDRDDLRRRGGRRAQRVPAGHFVRRHAGFLHGRHLRQVDRALGARGRERPELLRRDQRPQRGVRLEERVKVARHQGGGRIRRSAEGHDRDVDAGGRLEKLRRQVLRAARVDRAEVELAGVRPRGNEELAENSVTSQQVVDETLTNQDLGAASVTSSEVADQSLTANDLGPDSVGSSELQAGSVRASELGTIIQVTNSVTIKAGANEVVTATCPARCTITSASRAASWMAEAARTSPTITLNAPSPKLFCSHSRFRLAPPRDRLSYTVTFSPRCNNLCT